MDTDPPQIRAAVIHSRRPDCERPCGMPARICAAPLANVERMIRFDGKPGRRRWTIFFPAARNSSEATTIPKADSESNQICAERTARCGRRTVRASAKTDGGPEARCTEDAAHDAALSIERPKWALNPRRPAPFGELHWKAESSTPAIWAISGSIAW